MRTRTFQQYLIMVGIRSLEYTHSEEDIMDNIPYFKECYKRGLGAYYALLFFRNYLDEKEANTTKNE